MYKAIGGRYKKGKIIVSELPNVKDDTGVIITFLDQSLKIDERINSGHKDIPLSLPNTLEEIDVSINSSLKYRIQLEEVDKERARKKMLNSPFFSSEPADLGYTDASSLDKIIAGEKIE